MDKYKPVYMANSTKELAEQASIKVDSSVNIMMYFRSSDNLLRQGLTYEEEGDLEMAYVMLLKYATLVFDLQKHKGWAAASAPVKASIKQKVAKTLDQLEPMKNTLSKMYQDVENQKKLKQEEEAREAARQEAERVQELERQRIEYEAMEQERQAKAQYDLMIESEKSKLKNINQESRMFEKLQQNEYSQFDKSSSKVPPAQEPALYGVPQSSSHFDSETQRMIDDLKANNEKKAVFIANANAVINSNLAMSAMAELNEANLKSSNNEPPPVTSVPESMLIDLTTPDISGQPSAPLHKSLDEQMPASPFDMPPSSEPSQAQSYPPPQSVPQAQVQQPQTQVNQPQTQIQQMPNPQSQQIIQSQPQMQQQMYSPHPQMQYQMQSPQMMPPNGMYARNGPMQIPPANAMYGMNQMRPMNQMMPMNQMQMNMNPYANGRPQLMAAGTQAHNIPIQSPPVKATQIVPKAPEEPPRTIGGLRELHVDAELFTSFMDLARSNTVREIETCGILAGTLRRNVLYITHLIVPKQTGTSDTCAMTNEEDVFMYQDANDLLTFGWIHTHPNHDCFMSSVDMHTHSSYQFLLKEAIAVVVAPKAQPNFGIFGLTDPMGLHTISKCDRRGFHPHEKDLYKNVNHVKLKRGNPTYKVVDLRKS